MDRKDRIKRLGQRLEAIRLDRGLTVQQLAVRMGYTKKLRKGMRRIEQAEAGTEARELLARIAVALGEDLDALEHASVAQDASEREEWLNLVRQLVEARVASGVETIADAAAVRRARAVVDQRCGNRTIVNARIGAS